MVIKKRLGRVEINFTNRSLYTLIAFFAISIFAVGVYALSPGVTPNPGHSIQTVSPPASCNDGQYLKWVAPTGLSGQWVCSSVSSSGSGGDFDYASWFSGSGITMPSSIDMKLLVSKLTSDGDGKMLLIQAGGASGSVTDPSNNGGELRLSSGISTGTGNSFISFYTAMAGSTQAQDRNPSERMRILGNGNVGIGTTNPITKLDVSGNVRGTSFCIGSSCITSWPAGSSTTTIDGSDGSGVSGGAGYWAVKYVGATSSSYKGTDLGTYPNRDSKCVAQFGEGARVSTSSDFSNGVPNIEGWYNTFVFSRMEFSGDLSPMSDCATSGSNWGTIWRTTGVANPGPAPLNCGDSARILCSKPVFVSLDSETPSTTSSETTSSGTPSTLVWVGVGGGSPGNYGESCRDWLSRIGEFGEQRRVKIFRGSFDGESAGTTYAGYCLYQLQSDESISKRTESFSSPNYRPFDLFIGDDDTLVGTESLR